MCSLLDILYHKQEAFFSEVKYHLQGALLTRSYDALVAKKGAKLKPLSKKVRRVFRLVLC